jgi:hypothetical protein
MKIPHKPAEPQGSAGLRYEGRGREGDETTTAFSHANLKMR